MNVLHVHMYVSVAHVMQGLVESKGSLADNDLISTAYSLINVSSLSQNMAWICIQYFSWLNVFSTYPEFLFVCT